MLAACSPQASANPSPTGPKGSASPSSTSSQTPTAPGLSLSAIQRLNTKVGYIAAWVGTGLPLAKTSDGGASWQRLSVPADYITSLRFIDERVGWAGGFVNRDVAQIACQPAAPAGAQPCKGVVVRTEDGGHTWTTVLAIPP